MLTTSREDLLEARAPALIRSLGVMEVVEARVQLALSIVPSAVLEARAVAANRACMLARPE